MMCLPPVNLLSEREEESTHHRDSAVDSRDAFEQVDTFLRALDLRLERVDVHGGGLVRPRELPIFFSMRGAVASSTASVRRTAGLFVHEQSLALSRWNRCAAVARSCPYSRSSRA